MALSPDVACIIAWSRLCLYQTLNQEVPHAAKTAICDLVLYRYLFFQDKIRKLCSFVVITVAIGSSKFYCVAITLWRGCGRTLMQGRGAGGPLGDGDWLYEAMLSGAHRVNNVSCRSMVIFACTKLNTTT